MPQRDFLPNPHRRSPSDFYVMLAQGRRERVVSRMCVTCGLRHTHTQAPEPKTSRAYANEDVIPSEGEVSRMTQAHDHTQAFLCIGTQPTLVAQQTVLAKSPQMFTLKKMKKKKC